MSTNAEKQAALVAMINAFTSSFDDVKAKFDIDKTAAAEFKLSVEMTWNKLATTESWRDAK